MTGEGKRGAEFIGIVLSKWRSQSRALKDGIFLTKTMNSIQMPSSYIFLGEEVKTDG